MRTSRYILSNLLKIIIIILLMFVLFILGLMIGYGVVGDGKMTDVFNKDLWTHIAAFFKK